MLAYFHNQVKTLTIFFFRCLHKPKIRFKLSFSSRVICASSIKSEVLLNSLIFHEKFL